MQWCSVLWGDPTGLSNVKAEILFWNREAGDYRKLYKRKTSFDCVSLYQGRDAAQEYTGAWTVAALADIVCNCSFNSVCVVLHS